MSAFPLDNCTELAEQIKVEVMYFMSLHAGLAGLCFLLVLVYYPSRPDDLPSYTAGEKREDFLPGLRSFLTNRSTLNSQVEGEGQYCNAGTLFL